MSDLQVLFPKSLEVEVDGRSVQIRPVRVRDFEAFADVSAQLLAVLAEPTTERLFKFAADHKRLLALLVPSTTLSAWRIRRLPAAIAVELIVLAMRVNASFFDAALVRLASLSDGPKSSSN